MVKVAWYPFDAVRVWVNESGDSFPQYIRDRRALATEIEELKVSIATSQGNENTINKLIAENAELRNLLGAVPGERQVARVIARPNRLPYDLLMIDRGSDHGIEQFAPVFLGHDQVIGVVMRVQARTALVALTTTAGFTSTAYVYGPNIFTFAEGIGGGVLRVRVPQSVVLQLGDLVVLPAIDSGVFGAIAEIETSPTQPEQYGYITLPQSLQSVAYVSVGAEPIETHSFDEARAVVEEIRDDLFTVEVPPEMLVTPDTASTTATSTATTTVSNSAI
jgi:cell shape-determining protein MreC